MRRVLLIYLEYETKNVKTAQLEVKDEDIVELMDYQGRELPYDVCNKHSPQWSNGLICNKHFDLIVTTGGYG